MIAVSHLVLGVIALIGVALVLLGSLGLFVEIWFASGPGEKSSAWIAVFIGAILLVLSIGGLRA